MPEISLTGRSYYIDPKNPSPPLKTAAEGSILGPTQQRLMYTITQPRIQFPFQVAPTRFEMEGFGSEINEIKRPYSIPIADIYGGKLRRLSFEFAIIREVVVPPANGKKSFKYLDGITNDVEDQLERLQFISDTGIPVGFNNLSTQIQQYSWLIDDMKWTLSRDDKEGQVVAATCTMSFIEYRSARQRFILMPRFAYGVPSSATKATATNTGTGGGNLTAAQLYLKDAFELKVKNAFGTKKITYPFTKAALQALLNSQADIDKVKYFTIPDEWVKELNAEQKAKAKSLYQKLIGNAP